MYNMEYGNMVKFNLEENSDCLNLQKKRKEIKEKRNNYKLKNRTKKKLKNN